MAYRALNDGISGSDIDLVGRVVAIEPPRARGNYIPDGYVLSIATSDAEQRFYLPQDMTDEMPLDILGDLVHYSRWGSNHKLEILDQRAHPEVYTAGPAYQGTFERLRDWAAEKLQARKYR